MGAVLEIRGDSFVIDRGYFCKCLKMAISCELNSAPSISRQYHANGYYLVPHQ